MTCIQKSIMSSIALIVLAFNTLQGQPAPDFAPLIDRSEQRIEQALSEYQAYLGQTSDQKVSLVSRINELENELVRLRDEEQKARLAAKEEGVNLEDLKEEAKALDTLTQYAAGVLTEYLTNFESRIHLSEDQRYAAPLLDIRSRLEQTDGSPEKRLPILFETLEAGIARQESLVGGLVFTGRAITPAGGVKEGEIALVGPTAYFRAADDSANGILRFNSGTIEPGLSLLNTKQTAALDQVFAEHRGSLPFDPSLGNAMNLDRAKGTPLEHIQKGGWVGYTILLLGVLALIIGLVKALDLRRATIDESANVQSIAVSAIRDDPATAKKRAESVGGPLGVMLSTGVDFARADNETMLEAMETVIMRYRPRLERFLPFLATTAAVAPLMGLLGTVVGMIKTFTLIEVFGTGDAKSLSSGISEALITTELGLIVAIPALILHGIFSRILRSRIGAMEQVATEFSHHVAVENNALGNLGKGR